MDGRYLRGSVEDDHRRPRSLNVEIKEERDLDLPYADDESKEHRKDLLNRCQEKRWF